MVQKKVSMETMETLWICHWVLTYPELPPEERQTGGRRKLEDTVSRRVLGRAGAGRLWQAVEGTSSS